MAEVIPQINIDGTKIKNTWTEKEYVTDEVYNALNKAVIDLKNNNNLLDSNSILFREEYNSSSKNLNNAIHQGVYSFTNSAVNAPSGVNGGNLLVTNTSKTNQGTSIITQIAFCHNGAVYARTKNASENFTSWNKLAYITDTIARAIADKNGLQIDTTYIKNISSNNDTLTITKGNGNNSTVTVNNVSNSINSNNLVYSNMYKLNYGGGDSTEVNAISQNITNLSIGSWYSTGFKDLFSEGNPIRVAINHRNGNIKTTGSLSAQDNTLSGSVYFNKANNIDTGKTILLEFAETENVFRVVAKNVGYYLNFLNANTATSQSDLICNFPTSPTAPTPSTSDNSTRVATTAFVHSLVDAKNDVYIGNGTGSVNNTTFTIPLPSGYSRGQCRYVVVPNNIDYNYGFVLNVDQGTGAVSGYCYYVNTNTKYSLSFYYVVIAVK